MLSDGKAVVMIHKRMITIKIKRRWTKTINGDEGFQNWFKEWDSSGYESIKKEELF